MTRKPRWANTWGVDGVRLKTSDSYWKQPFKWNAKAAKAGRRDKVFCGSLCDVFDDHPSINDYWRIQLWDTIDKTPDLIWMLLTKRPENILEYLPPAHPGTCWEHGIPPNVWLGVSVENRATASERIPILLETNAKIKFLSCEPLLESIIFDCNFLKWSGDQPEYSSSCYNPDGISWVIIGGESGANARPMHPLWVAWIRNQCENYGVPFFFKQWGSWCPIYAISGVTHSNRPSIAIWPDGTIKDEWSVFKGDKDFVPMTKLGKKKSGNKLYGKTYQEFPYEVDQHD